MLVELFALNLSSILTEAIPADGFLGVMSKSKFEILHFFRMSINLLPYFSGKL